MCIWFFFKWHLTSIVIETAYLSRTSHFHHHASVVFSLENCSKTLFTQFHLWPMASVPRVHSTKYEENWSSEQDLDHDTIAGFNIYILPSINWTLISADMQPSCFGRTRHTNHICEVSCQCIWIIARINFTQFDLWKLTFNQPEKLSGLIGDYPNFVTSSPSAKKIGPANW